MGHIIFVHGRKPKPDREVLEKLWYDAIVHGLTQDHGEDVANAFEEADKSFVYYGDLSNKALLREGEREAEAIRLAAERKATLVELTAQKRMDFFRKSKYRAIRQKREALKSSIALFLIGAIEVAHTDAEAASFIGDLKADLKSFWNRSGEFNRGVRMRINEALGAAFSSKERVLIISHSLGSMIVYDCLWSFSWLLETDSGTDNLVDTWITLGSPLGAGIVKKELSGAKESGKRKYPSNVRKWINVAAKDDYIAADKDLADDFEDMIDYHHTKIEDEDIYSLAKRNGRAYPHSALGYLIHPIVSNSIAEWLRTGE